MARKPARKCWLYGIFIDVKNSYSASGSSLASSSMGLEFVTDDDRQVDLIVSKPMLGTIVMVQVVSSLEEPIVQKSASRNHFTHDEAVEGYVTDIQVMLHRRKYVSRIQKEHRPVGIQGANYDATGHKDETDTTSEAHPYDLWGYKEPIMMLLGIKIKLILQGMHILIILIAKDDSLAQLQG